MKLIGRETIESFVFEHADARGPVRSWVVEVETAVWRTSHDIKAQYASASFLADNTVIFNIKGNTYRLVVQVAYKTSVVVVKWVGTHAEYSKR